jgi:hypothetical protein
MLGGRSDAAAAGAGGGRSSADDVESHTAAPAEEAYGGSQAPSGPEISDEDIPF